MIVSFLMVVLIVGRAATSPSCVNDTYGIVRVPLIKPQSKPRVIDRGVDVTSMVHVSDCSCRVHDHCPIVVVALCASMRTSIILHGLWSWSLVMSSWLYDRVHDLNFYMCSWSCPFIVGCSRASWSSCVVISLMVHVHLAERLPNSICMLLV